MARHRDYPAHPASNSLTTPATCEGENHDRTHPGPACYFPSIEKKYGRPINDWLDLIHGSELTKHKALVDWLKAGYGVGHGHATALVGYALAQRNAS